MKKIIIAFTIIMMNFYVAKAYNEIDCSTDTVFADNFCNQCFDWWTKDTNEKITLLDDTWINSSSNDRIMYKEEQDFPFMLNLDKDNVYWDQNPVIENNFWKYTGDLEALYSEESEWYILPNSQSVTWIKQDLWAYYSLSKNSLEKDKNIWLLVFPFNSHNIDENGEINISDGDTHRECVLYKSSWTTFKDDTKVYVEPKEDDLPEPEPKEMTKVETWAEHVVLWFFAMLLAGAFLRRKKS